MINKSHPLVPFHRHLTILMKLISVFEVLTMVASTLAATTAPGTCEGKLPKFTVDKCNNQPCTFEKRSYSGEKSAASKL